MAPRSVDEPVTAFVVNHGRHASLVLWDSSTDRYVRYAYGNWRWYALSDEGFWQGARALLWPSQAALGRRELPASVNGGNFGQHIAEGFREIIPVVVDARRADRLRASLDDVFRANASTKVYNARYDLEFVHHPDDYSALHNSTTVMAGWLESMGCTVAGPKLWSRWRVD